MKTGNKLDSILEIKIEWAPIKKPHARLFIRFKCSNSAEMYLMYYLDAKGERVYTFSKVAPDGTPTMSAHPAKFSPEDKYSRERILIKKRFGILPTQLPPLKY